MPSRSSRSHIAYFVWCCPGCGFLVCENLIAASMPPSSTSSRCFELRRCRRVVCEQYVRERALVLGERMAREVEAEHFFLHRQPLLLGPTRACRAATAAWRLSASSSSSPNRPLLAALAIGEHGGADLHGPVDARPSAATACAPSESNAPALISVSIVARLQACGSTRSQKSNRLVNGPPLAAPRRSPRPRRCRSL